MECRDCPMRLFEVKVYARNDMIDENSGSSGSKSDGGRSSGNSSLFVEDIAISPAWMSQEKIDAVNSQFRDFPNFKYARYAEKTGLARCGGYSIKDENFRTRRYS